MIPQFSDYHRTVIGYHGTKRSIAEALVLGKKAFQPSTNDDDWLGHGVYFWEYAPQQAWWWARRRSKNRDWSDEIAVVASMIRLGNCLDLLDPSNVSLLRDFHGKALTEFKKAGKKMPENANQYKRLDCEVFEYAYTAAEKALPGVNIQTARAVYVPTGSKGRAWKRSWIHQDAHIQLCVRDLSCILGTWLVKPEEDPPDVTHGAQFNQ